MNQEPTRSEAESSSELPRAARTPRLERLLDSVRGRLSRQVWLHGLGTLLAVLCAWLVFCFFADRVLRVPRAVRILHGVVLIALAITFVWRALLRPLWSLPSRTGLAILFERAHPDVQERFISAVQFQQEGREASGSPVLVRRALLEADELAGGFAEQGARGVFDESEPRARFFLGLGALVVTALAGVTHRLETSIFVERMLGRSTPWPQATVLTVDVPMEGPGVKVSRTPESIQVRVARGTDVPVLIKAQGEIPSEVTLHFQAGRDMVLTPSGGGTFRTLLRSCQENITFTAVGGDDLDGRPSVSIEVLRPPDVEGVAFEVHPPDYSGLESQLLFQREVDVLAGSEVRVMVLPSPADADGIARILPDDRAMALFAGPFPWPPAPEAGAAQPAEERMGLGFDWSASASIGFRIELSDSTGLTNPDPGLFRIRVIEDRPPEVQILQPTRSEFEIVRGGAFPLRARAEDDFGLVSMGWRIGQSKSGSELVPFREGAFELVPASGDARPFSTGHVRLEVDDLKTAEQPVEVDQRFEIEVYATDNRRPEQGIGKSTRFRARVVTPEELLRRMQDRLAQTRLAAVRLSDLQREKRERVRELLEASEGDATGLRGESLALAGALGGQRRVTVDARALSRELAAVTEDILYARVDEKAGPLLDFYDAKLGELQDALFHPEPWQALAKSQRDGALGSGGFAGNLVLLVDLALEISELQAPEAAIALVAAEKASNASEMRAALVEAEKLQARSLQRIDDLLVSLAEWDNFQNILALTRDILNRQKALRERTQQFASQK